MKTIKMIIEDLIKFAESVESEGLQMGNIHGIVLIVHELAADCFQLVISGYDDAFDALTRYSETGCYASQYCGWNDGDDAVAKISEAIEALIEELE